MGRIELSAEVKAIEVLIDAGQQGVASSRLKAAQPADRAGAALPLFGLPVRLQIQSSARQRPVA